MTSILVASVLCALPPPRAPAPQPDQPVAQQQLTDEEIRARVDAFLRTIDTRIPPEQWRALGPRGAAILEAMAQDRSLLPTRRAAAVVGLSAIGSPGSASVLLSLAQSSGEPLNVRLVAVHGAAGVVPSAELASTLKPVLETSDDHRVRAAAAEVLSRSGACGLVRAQAQRERDALVMRSALKACDDR